MTKQEREQQKVIYAQERAARQNERMAKELSAKEFKQRARFEALSAARYLSPVDGRVVLPQKGKYDVVKEAEKIYQWLIKVLK